MSIRPTVVPLTSLADAASMGVDLALQERASIASSDPSLSMLPPPSTTGIYPPEQTGPVLA